MNRFAKMKKERIYTLFETLSKHAKIILSKLVHLIFHVSRKKHQKKTATFSCNCLFFNCRGDRIRTCDPLLPKQMRYRTALRPENELKNWWRREGDSNPRYSIPYDSLANCWFQPLTHLSNCADKSSAFYCSCKLLT